MVPSALSLLCSILVFITVDGSSLPSYITPCKVRSPDFSQCAVKNGNAAIPSLVNGDKKLGLPTFNPLFVPFIEFSSGAFGLNATDINISGLKDVRLTDARVDLTKNSVTLDLIGSEIQLDCNYNVGGKIVSLPIEGHGKGRIVFYEPKVSYTFLFEVYDKKGKKHANITTDSLEIEPNKITIQLDDLFGGNKELGDNTNKFLNENWKEVLNEFRPALSQIIGSVIRSIFNPIAKIWPLNEIFIDY